APILDNSNAEPGRPDFLTHNFRFLSSALLVEPELGASLESPPKSRERRPEGTSRRAKPVRVPQFLRECVKTACESSKPFRERAVECASSWVRHRRVPRRFEAARHFGRPSPRHWPWHCGAPFRAFERRGWASSAESSSRRRRSDRGSNPRTSAPSSRKSW